MFTVCPKCSLTLVVTAADLKVAQGFVRCGRCSNVFNAIEALSEEKQAAPAEPQLEDEATTGTYEAIVLESDGDEELEDELETLAAQIEAQTQEQLAVTPAEAGVQSKELLSLDPGLRRDDEGGEESPWPWRLGAVALIVLLALQVLHHYRHDLAAQPQLHEPVTRFYGAFGVPLVPRWNVAAYEVRQLGAVANASNPNQLLVRASIKNGARQSQPLPLLRVTVQDRFGNRIAVRDVPPKSYAPHAPTLLSSGQRVDIEMRFADPGSAAVGFEIDACLAAPGGGVNCANYYH